MAGNSEWRVDAVPLRSLVSLQNSILDPYPTLNYDSTGLNNYAKKLQQIYDAGFEVVHFDLVRNGNGSGDLSYTYIITSVKHTI